MSAPLEIVFKNLDRSEFVEKRVMDEAAKLERFLDDAGSMRVVVEAENKSQHNVDLYRVGIHVTVPPGQSLDVNRAGPKDHAHEDVYTAVRDAFRAITRQLEEHRGRTAGRH